MLSMDRTCGKILCGNIEVDGWNKISILNL